MTPSDEAKITRALRHLNYDGCRQYMLSNLAFHMRRIIKAGVMDCFQRRQITGWVRPLADHVGPYAHEPEAVEFLAAIQEVQGLL
jgi:hypothetical protein